MHNIVIFEGNEEDKAMVERPLRRGRSKHIDVGRHFMRESVAPGELKIGHVASKWQHAGVFTGVLAATLYKRHRAVLNNLPDAT